MTIVLTLCRASIDHEFHVWKVLPEPERLTELYFTNPSALPATYAPGQAQTAAFTVHNLERQTFAYHYIVTANGQTLATGSFSLEKGKILAVSQPITMPPLGAQAQITITLTNPHESIAYEVKQ